MEMLMKNPYIASSIANYFISNKNLDVDNLKLNKLVYISYGFALACFKEELELFKEPIQAWRLGPVIPSIYHEFKRYGYNSIKNLSYFYDPMQEKKIFFSIDEDDTKTKEVLEAVKNNYGNLKNSELIGRTHSEDTPWFKNYKENVYNGIIPKEDIKEYYTKLLK